MESFSKEHQLPLAAWSSNTILHQLHMMNYILNFQYSIKYKPTQNYIFTRADLS